MFNVASLFDLGVTFTGFPSKSKYLIRLSQTFQVDSHNRGVRHDRSQQMRKMGIKDT